jgi:chaperonin GroEL
MGSLLDQLQRSCNLDGNADEAKKLKEAFDDAISATKAAIAEGVLPGAGLARLRAIGAVDAEEAKAAEDEKTGLRILKRALETW